MTSYSPGNSGADWEIIKCFLFLVKIEIFFCRKSLPQVFYLAKDYRKFHILPESPLEHL